MMCIWLPLLLMLGSALLSWLAARACANERMRQRDTQYDELNGKYSAVLTDIDGYKTRYQTLNNDHLSLKSTINALEGDNKALILRLGEWESKYAKLEADNKALLLRIGEWESKYAKLEGDNKALILRIGEWESKYAKLEGDNKALLLRIGEWESKYAKLEADGLAAKANNDAAILAWTSKLDTLNNRFVAAQNELQQKPKEVEVIKEIIKEVEVI